MLPGWVKSLSGPHVTDEHVVVPDFVGMQALNASVLGQDRGLLLHGPDPDAATPLMHGAVTHQQPPSGARAHRWDPVTVWVESGRDAGVREPLDPIPPDGTLHTACESEEP
jgi:hypothetical protein